MFCALKGATLTPSRASQRQMPATTTLFPASECVPATSRVPLKACPSGRPARRERRRAPRAPSTGRAW